MTATTPLPSPIPVDPGTSVERPRTLLIGGVWETGTGAIAVDEPATGRIVGAVAEAAPEQVAHAVAAATEAFPAWRDTSPRARAAILRTVADRLEARIDTIARVLSAETGKLLAESEGEIRLSAEFFRWYAEEGRRADGRLPRPPVPGKRLEVTLHPVGPVAVLTPWNFPVSIQARKLAPALAAGCTVVSRPSSVAPLSVVALFECLVDAGCPAGTVNLVTGEPGSTAEALITDERIAAVTFTGSTAVGRRLAELAARGVKRITLELGGNAPFLVLADADPEVAVEQAMVAKFRNNGQSCIAMNRLLLERPIADAFLERFLDRIGSLVPGDPVDRMTTLGPVISADAAARVGAWVDASRAQRVHQPLARVPDAGHFVRPAVVEDPAPDSALWSQEVFGPAVGVRRFDGAAEMIAEANATPFGLAAYVMTRDLGASTRAAASIRAGIVGVNDALPTTPEAPFGGIGVSGLGREGGSEGMLEFLETTYVSMRP
jgi:succinate-semialdehyde dehydrogenase/glutarate-semialdehyde dehydrogenase